MMKSSLFVLLQVLIRWSLQHGTSVLPKSTSAERIKVPVLYCFVLQQKSTRKHLTGLALRSCVCASLHMCFFDTCLGGFCVLTTAI